MHIQVINGTTREGRFSERIAHWVLGFAKQYDGVEFELVDLRDHPLPFFDGTAPMWTPRQYANDEVARFGRTVDRADGYIVLAAEYNHGYSAVLKNAMDWTYAEWHRKPVSFVGWGSVGGARAIEQLRQVAVEFEMAPLRHAVHIAPDLYLPALEQPDPTDSAVFAPAEPFLKLLTDDLLWWAGALRTARTRDAA
ncbi:NADPH-dependent FMN reductase [Catellatospora citrea]|uniref:FMN reductase n=1 Tax=Catellatospora citrea TaxID=53366 RepID=A0A8J3KIF8_9ACTN|nr:NAD(P)H-dependent oxidoreductase [Catellatospora citrea]RKE02659.1 NAD(P)H-dependent FMN reductase [Catellatospora citrea]GIF99488.1 FMN reductase [Catellatospora citrea]